MYNLKVNFATNPKKEFTLKELSFFEYKNLCKTLFYEEDTKKISQILDKLVDTIIVDDVKPDNVIEKILILLELRALTLGNDIRLKIGEKSLTIEKDFLTSIYNKPISDVVIIKDNIKLTLNVPCNFLINETDASEIISKSLKQVETDRSIINFTNLQPHEQRSLLSILPGIPISTIFDNLKTNITKMSFNLGDNIVISPFDATIIFLLKAILIEPYSEILDMEYGLRKGLQMNVSDFQQTPYPECKIMLSKLFSESKEKENKIPSIGGPIEHGV